MSVFEQYGYIYRFYLTYCVGSHANPTKCEKKLKKYSERVVNAIQILESKTEKKRPEMAAAAAAGGGRRKIRTVKKNKKRRRYTNRRR
jgi:hypothetical protein